jgi:hypothetical protein
MAPKLTDFEALDTFPCLRRRFGGTLLSTFNGTIRA